MIRVHCHQYGVGRWAATVFVAAMLLGPGETRAQAYATDRGSVLVDGTAGLDQRTTTEEDGREVSSTSFRIAPAAHVFVFPGLAVGGTFEYRSISVDVAEPGTADLSATNELIGIGPTVSYYFGEGTRRILPFLSGTYAYSKLTLDNTAGADNTQTMHYLDIAGGLVAMLSDHVGLTAELFFRDGEIEEDTGLASRTIDDRTVGLRVGVAAFVY